jgi:hypothetical protein
LPIASWICCALRSNIGIGAIASLGGAFWLTTVAADAVVGPAMGVPPRCFVSRCVGPVVGDVAGGLPGRMPIA